MAGYNAREVRRCYDLSADEYAKHFLNELDGKPYDRSVIERFSQMVPSRGLVYDFGCGCGHTTNFLAGFGRQTVIGLDFSEKSIELARRLFPKNQFDVDDMLSSHMESGSAEGIIAFYAIVHFCYREVEKTLGEWFRLLKPGGYCLFSFHVGRGTLSVDNFLDIEGACATWRFLNTDRVLGHAESTGFLPYEVVERYPYADAEHPSKRAYVILQKPT